MYEWYAADLYRYGYNLVRDKPLIEDVLHELFIHLYHSRGNLSHTDNIRFYLYRAFRNRLLNALERKKRWAHVGFSEEMADFVIDTRESEWVEEQADQEKKRLMFRELNNLPKRQKEILYLVYLKGLSYQEAADIMEITIKTVYNSLQVALNTLKKHLLVAFEKNGVFLLSFVISLL